MTLKYGQKVRVKSGFYEGIEGTAIREKILGFNAMLGNGTMVADIEITVKLEIEFDIHEAVFPKDNLEIIN